MKWCNQMLKGVLSVTLVASSFASMAAGPAYASDAQFQPVIDGIKDSVWNNVPTLAQSTQAGWQGFHIGQMKMASDGSNLFFWVDALNVPNWGDTGQMLDLALNVNDQDSGISGSPWGDPYNFSGVGNKPNYHVMIRIKQDAQIGYAAVYKSNDFTTVLADSSLPNGAQFAVNRQNGFEGKIPLSLLGIQLNDSIKAIAVLGGNDTSAPKQHGAFDVIPSNPANHVAQSWNESGSPNVLSTYSGAFAVQPSTFSALLPISSTPADSATGVTGAAPVKITFGEPVAVTNANHIDFRDENNQSVAFTSTVSGNDLVLTPADAYARATRYAVHLSAGAVTGQTSMAENGDYQMAFTTVEPIVNPDRTVTFQYRGDSVTNSVYFAGDMNGWSSSAGPMVKDANNNWTATTSVLTPGKHEYKFVIDGGSWTTDPRNSNVSDAGNSVVLVPGFYGISVFGQIPQGGTAAVTALGLKSDGSEETLSGATWSVSPSDAAEIDANGTLTAKALPDGTDSLPITITGQKDGVTVTKDTTILRNVTEQPGGKTVVLVGDIQAAGGAANWSPGDMNTRMLYQGHGLYKITLRNVPAGNYQYKVALSGSWAENYGANGTFDGSNIALSLSNTQDVTFYYSDTSHLILDSTTYTAVAPVLSGTGISANTVMYDYLLDGIYSVTATLPQGSYNNLLVDDGSKVVNVPAFTITDSSKSVTISYDASTGIVFNNLSVSVIDTASLYFNSKDSEFKSVYGAVPTSTNVTFSLQSKKNDLTEAKLVLVSGTNTRVLDMQKNGTFSADTANQYDRWSIDFAFDAIGVYQYYFAVTNGSDVKAYGDDDGYYGAGGSGNLGKVGKYDLTVFDKNFKTPDWIKHAVVYQIFPDRFFNGDTSNDYAAKLAEGDIPYEFSLKWNSIPEYPTLEFLKDSQGNILKDAEGNSVVDPDYKANIGDGRWNNDVFGGDLKGIQAKLTYLKSLGVNTLYLNPTAAASSNHRYDTKNYKEIDPLLGKMDDYVNLVNTAHQMGMHLILDGVFNHVSDDSVYFDRYGKYVKSGQPIGGYQYWAKVYDLMNANVGMTQQTAEQKVQESLTAQGITDYHYKDWFIVKNEKDASGVYSYSGWFGNSSLPEIQSLNGSEHNVASWANEVIDGPNSYTKYWLNQGADGWRLDAADSASDDTWRHFRPAVKESYPDDIIIGEIWVDSSKYLLGNMFDSVTNYRFRNAVQGYVTGAKDAVATMNDLEKMREQYPKEAFDALMNIVDSHDSKRIISEIDGIGSSKEEVAPAPSADALAMMKLVPFLQMTYPGAPTIYYGDELGMPGSSDPDNRRPMTWGMGNRDLVEWYATLANIRNANAVLRTGNLVPLHTGDSNAQDVLAYTRNDASNHALIVANRSTTAIAGLNLQVGPEIPDGTILTNALDTTETYTVQNGAVIVNVPAQSGAIWIASYTPAQINEEGLKDAYDPSFIVNDRIRATGVTVDSSETSMQTGATAQVTAAVSPNNATYKGVTWTSSNEQAAKVDANGVITAIGAGTATITVTTGDGGFTANVKVTVSARPSDTGGSSHQTPQPQNPTPVQNPGPVGVAVLPDSGAQESTKTDENGRKVTQVAVDAKALADALKSLTPGTSQNGIVEIRVKQAADKVLVILPASAINEAITRKIAATIKVKSDTSSYSLPITAIDVASLSKQLGIDGNQVQINIVMTKVQGGQADSLNTQVANIGAAPLIAPIDFSITAEGNGKSVEINQFNTYVERTITVPQNIGSDDATVVMYDQATGALFFVPATFTESSEGKTEVTFKRNGNSMYTVIRNKKSFDDIAGHWAKSDIELLSAKLIVTGDSDQMFAPDRSITRAEFTALLARSLGLIPNEPAAAYSDVSAKDWYAGDIGVAVKAGLVEGFEDGSFRPSDRVTREQMAVMLSRAMNFAGKKATPASLSAFTDSSAAGDWAVDSLAQAVGAGILNGTTSSTLSPGDQATRAQAVKMLRAFLQYEHFIN